MYLLYLTISYILHQSFYFLGFPEPECLYSQKEIEFHENYNYDDYILTKFNMRYLCMWLVVFLTHVMKLETMALLELYLN